LLAADDIHLFSLHRILIEAYINVHFTRDLRGSSAAVSSDMSDVRYAFTKALALAKVGYNCSHKLFGEACKKNDAHTIAFLECIMFEAVCLLLL
jgi:hypothetical protein